MFFTPGTPRIDFISAIRWLSYFNFPTIVTLPFTTTALSPNCEPPDCCNRRSTSFCRALSAAGFFPPIIVRSLQKRSVRRRAKTQASGRGIDHRGRDRTVKEDNPSSPPFYTHNRAAARIPKSLQNEQRFAQIFCCRSCFRPRQSLPNHPRVKLR